MTEPERKRHLGLFLAALLALGLLAYAVVHLLRWQSGGEAKEGGITVRQIALNQAPMMVQDAAARLATSRVGYVMPMGDVTYLVISSGVMGERMVIVGARRAPDSPLIAVRLGSATNGEPLIVAEMKASVSDPRMVHFELDNYTGVIPALINRDGLTLARLPDKEMLAMVGPQPNTRVMGNMVQVSGYARFPDGRVSIQVFSTGKGRVLGEATNVVVAALGPDWGSFRANVPLTLPQGTDEGVLLIYHPQSDAKVAIPVRFGAK
jgi:hypothetical protein